MKILHLVTRLRIPHRLRAQETYQILMVCYALEFCFAAKTSVYCLHVILDFKAFLWSPFTFMGQTSCDIITNRLLTILVKSFV